jgi:hypothetical protein
LVAEYESSGLSRIEFCRERGLALSTLGRYRKRRKRQAAAGSNTLLAVEVSGRVPAPVAATLADARGVLFEIRFAERPKLPLGDQAFGASPLQPIRDSFIAKGIWNAI